MLNFRKTPNPPSERPGNTPAGDGVVSLEDGQYGRRAILRSAWSDELIDYFARNRVVELELNQAKGWHGDELSFLSELPRLKALDILDLNISDIGAIHCLRGLRSLGITTYCSTKIDFSAFPELESCGLEWRPKVRALFECGTLRDLFVNRYKGKVFAPFASLVNLESLAILNAPVGTLQGIGALTKLRSLRLANLRRLTTLAGIEELVNLEELDINTCRGIRSIREVGALSSLRKLFLFNCGDIESLKPIEAIAGIEEVCFPESTNITDGDMTPLVCEKHLFRVSYQNRRHYTHRREEFAGYWNPH